MMSENQLSELSTNQLRRLRLQLAEQLHMMKLRKLVMSEFTLRVKRAELAQLKSDLAMIERTDFNFETYKYGEHM